MPAASTEFSLVKLEAGALVSIYDASGQLLKFATGADAEKEASRLSKVYGVKVQPRRVFDRNWREREEARLKDGTYKVLPWADQEWWKALKPIWKDHFPHVSLQKQALIAFTENDEKGAADVQTPIKPGRYFEKFFGEGDNKLDEYVIKELCCVLASKYESQDLQFTDDPDEIEEIYTTGPNSCMSKETKSYSTGTHHPVRSYAAGDLQLAYLRRKGRVVARCIVWPEKKFHNRIYGDSGLMSTVLKKAGFKQYSLVGARLKRVVHSLSKNEFVFVAPHVDDANWLCDKGDHLLIVASGDKAIQIGNGSGRTDVLIECPFCKTASLKSESKKYSRGGETRGACFSCASQHGIVCSATGCYIDKELAITVRRGKSTTMVSPAAAAQGLVFKCDGTQEWFHVDDKIVLADGRSWSREYARTHMVPCATCGANKDKDAAVCCPFQSHHQPSPTATNRWNV